MKWFSILIFYLHYKLRIVFSGYMVIMDNVLENDQCLFHLSYSVLTDQQSKVQATKKVYHEWTFIILLLNWTIANNS